MAKRDKPTLGTDRVDGDGAVSALQGWNHLRGAVRVKTSTLRLASGKEALGGGGKDV